MGQLFQRSYSIDWPLSFLLLLFHCFFSFSSLTPALVFLLLLWNRMLFSQSWAKLLNETMSFGLFEFYFVILWWDVSRVVKISCSANLTKIWSGINLVHILHKFILTLLQISWLALLTFSINFASSNCRFVE